MSGYKETQISVQTSSQTNITLRGIQFSALPGAGYFLPGSGATCLTIPTLHCTLCSVDRQLQVRDRRTQLAEDKMLATKIRNCEAGIKLRQRKWLFSDDSLCNRVSRLNIKMLGRTGYSTGPGGSFYIVMILV